jgi:flagellar basal-body rod protein FlgB
MLAQMMTNLDFQGQALVLRSQRQQVLASNIANADTPGYVGREFNFTQKLMEASGQGLAPGAGVVSTHAAHMPMRAQGMSTQELYAMPSQSSADKNTIDMDRERAVDAEYQSMLDKALRCWIDEAPMMRLTDVCKNILPLGAEARRYVASIDLDAIIRAIAEHRALAFAEQSRTDNTGNDQ